MADTTMTERSSGGAYGPGPRAAARGLARGPALSATVTRPNCRPVEPVADGGAPRGAQPDRGERFGFAAAAYSTVLAGLRRCIHHRSPPSHLSAGFARRRVAGGY